MLFGDTTVEGTSDSNPAGAPQAWPYTASSSGSATEAEVYLATGNAATKLAVGLYSDASGKPGTLLASGSTTTLQAGAWNEVALGGAAVTSGTHYWLALLGTGGTPMFVDRGAGTCSTSGSQGGLSAMPSTWGQTWQVSGYCPASFYVDGTMTGGTTTTPGGTTTTPGGTTTTPGGTTTTPGGTTTTPGGTTTTPGGTTTTPGGTTTTPGGSASVLFGDTAVEPTSDSNPAGAAQAWPYTAAANGSATDADVYLGTSNAATKLAVGLYSDASGKPGTLLASGSTTTLHAGAWNDVTLTGATVTSGTHYWLALLGTGGTPIFVDRGAGTCTTSGNESGSSTMPSSWGQSWQVSGYCPASFYLNGTTASATGNQSPPETATTPTTTTPTTTTPTTTTPTTTTQTTTTRTTTTQTTTTPPTNTTPTTTTTTSTTPTPPASPPASSGVVGFKGAPTPTCSAVVAAGQDPTSALASAPSRSTVCLANGTWPNGITISRALTNTVTLAAQNPGQAIAHGFNTNGYTVSNLTVEGLNMSRGVWLIAAGTNDTFEYNTMEGWGDSDAQSDSAFFIYPGESGAAAGAATGISMIYNQIDNVPQCLQDDTNGGNTFSHNVCGPGIGKGGSADVHYTQTDGLNNETIDNNAFEGPLAAGAGGHINVSHLAGSNDEFNNNILWHVQGDQHLQWNDDATSTNLEANNNLDVEDPSESGGAFEQIANNFSISGFTQNNNTVIGARGETASDYTIEGSPRSCSVSNNIGVTNPGNGSFSVAAGCASSNNASDDGSGGLNWAPAWQNATWTPNAGSPWNPPPASYYKPATIASTYGYQGTIGP